MTSVLILGSVLAATAVLAVVLRAGHGRVRMVGDRFTPGELERLGVSPGGWVLLEVTAPGCTTCAAARRVLDAVAAAEPGVTVAVADVAQHPDVARAHRVLRAPTTFVVAPDGSVRARIAGVPVDGEIRDLLARGTALQR
jgi:thiol-disulfide isomerase/thioredoxin